MNGVEKDQADSVITEDIKKLIGVEQTFTYEVEKNAIRKVARAIEDSNPLWQDEEYAKKTRYAGMIAPPSFFTSLGLGEAVWAYARAECPLKSAVNGEYEVEYYTPIRPGDIITTTVKLTDVEEKKGKKGSLLLMNLELVCRNQKGETAVMLRNVLIRV